MKGQTEKADKIVSNIEAKTAAKGIDVPAVPEEEIQRRENAEVVKDLPWSFLFKKSMITRTLTAMFLCFVMNVLVYTVISWTPTILKANGFDPHMSTVLTVVMQLGIPVLSLIHISSPVTDEKGISRRPS